MEEHEEKRRQHGKKEMAQAKLHHDWQRRVMEDYYVAASEKNLDEVQFGYNISMMMDILQEWHDKIDPKKKPDHHKKFMAMRTALVEMLTHQMSLRQKLGFSIVETKKWRDQWNIKADEVEKLKDEVRALKAQIKFNEQNG